MKLRELGTVLLVVLGIMGLLTVGVTATGKQQEFCEQGLGGKYTPGAVTSVPAPGSGNVCPGGSWGNLPHAKPAAK